MFLLIPSTIGQSHLNRIILIALDLERQCQKVAFVFRENLQILKHYNFQVFPVADAVITDFSSNVFATFTPSLIEQCVTDELKAIETFKPDVIVGDFRLTAAISSKVSDIPYISVVNAYMTDYFDPVDVMIPKDARPRDHRIASAASKTIQAAQKRQLATNFRKIARKYGIKHLNSLYDFLTGDLTLIADLPEFCPLENLPESFCYIGPLIWEGIDEPIPEYLNDLGRDRKLIYATAGNTGQKQLIQLVIDAFKDDPAYEVVLTTGAFISPDSVPKYSNIHVERFIPGSAVLKQAHAIIHCAGNGTTYQALAQGVPAVVIPFNNDQKINAWLIKRRHVGIPLSSAGLTGKVVKAAVQKVIADPEIRTSLNRFQGILARTNGPENAATEIMNFLKSE
jgi:MGT family glycosyltransferase